MKLAPYIVFEGADGVGKTTISKALVAAIKQRGGEVAHLRQPGRISRAGQLIDDVFRGRARFEPRAMLWLFAAELADMEPMVEEMRADGVTVISDRHTMISSFIYQVPIHGRPVVEAVMRAIKPAKPSLTYIVDASAEIAMQRQKKRAVARNKFYEPADVKKLDELIQRYRNVPTWLEPPTCWPSEIKVLDGALPVQENVRSVLDDLDQGGCDE